MLSLVLNTKIRNGSDRSLQNAIVHRLFNNLPLCVNLSGSVLEIMPCRFIISGAVVILADFRGWVCGILKSSPVIFHLLKRFLSVAMALYCCIFKRCIH